MGGGDEDDLGSNANRPGGAETRGIGLEAVFTGLEDLGDQRGQGIRGADGVRPEGRTLGIIEGDGEACAAEDGASDGLEDLRGDRRVRELSDGHL
jgi:hypothetical protein